MNAVGVDTYVPSCARIVGPQAAYTTAHLTAVPFRTVLATPSIVTLSGKEALAGGPERSSEVISGAYYSRHMANIARCPCFGAVVRPAARPGSVHAPRCCACDRPTRRRCRWDMRRRVARDAARRRCCRPSGGRNCHRQVRASVRVGLACLACLVLGTVCTGVSTGRLEDSCRAGRAAVLSGSARLRVR